MSSKLQKRLGRIEGKMNPPRFLRLEGLLRKIELEKQKNLSPEQAVELEILRETPLDLEFKKALLKFCKK